MAEIAKVVPILSVPLVAAALLGAGQDRASLRVRIGEIADQLVAAGAVLKLPPQGLDVALTEGLTPLLGRGIVVEEKTGLKVQAKALLAFYAAPVQQLLEAPADL